MHINAIYAYKCYILCLLLDKYGGYWGHNASAYIIYYIECAEHTHKEVVHNLRITGQ
jgi:hypothetical protein